MVKRGLVAASLVWPNTLFANFVGNDTQNFNPNTSGLDFITVEGSETVGVGLLNSGFFVSESKNSLPDTFSPVIGQIPSHDTLTFGDLNLGYGLAKRFDLGINFSYLMNQNTDREAPGAQFAGTGLNEIRLGLKASLLARAPLGLAFLTSLNFNQSSNNPFAGINGLPTLNLQAIADYRLGKILVAGNLGYRLRSPGQPIANSVYEPLPNQYVASAAASYYFTGQDLRLVAEIYAAKPTRSVAYIDANKVASEVLLGARYDALPNVALNAGAGTRTGEGLFTPDWRIYAGVSWNFDILQRTEVAAAAPQTPKFKHYLGYLPPDVEALKDTDFDDIAKTHEFQLRTTIPDRDIPEVKPPFEIIRLASFNFETGSDRIRAEFFSQLDKLAAYLAMPPKVLKIRVEGHTDSLGSLAGNRKLSQKRSDALKAYLAKQPGLENLSIEPAGFGADRPIRDNANFQGRQQNRRVEIRILRSLPEVPESVEPVH